MSDKTLILEINVKEHDLYISLHNQEAVTIRYEVKPFSKGPDDISKECNKMINAVNRYLANQEKKDDALVEMKSLGNQLCARLLTPKIQQRLIDNDGRTTYLILSIDDNLVHIPWELLRINDKFLCEIFRIGRVVKTRQEVIDRDKPVLKSSYRMLVVSNPTGDLPCAEKEEEAIVHKIDSINSLKEQMLIECHSKNHISSHDLQNSMNDYDILHFSGHTYFDPKQPENSGWRLNKENLTAHDIKESLTNAPSLVVCNACQSARTEKWNKDQLHQSAYGIANAFLLSGVRHYVGSLWDISDSKGSEFGSKFYNNLLFGDSIGEAMFQARRELIEDGQDTSWAAYILYGDPKVTYIQPKGSIPCKNKEIISPISNKKRGISKIDFNLNQLINNLSSLRSIIVIILILCLFCSIYSKNKTQEIDQIRKQHIREQLIQTLDKKQSVIEKIFNQIRQLYGPIQTPQCFNATVIIETMLEKLNKKRIIQAAIESIITDETHFHSLVTTPTALKEIVQCMLVQGPPFHYKFPKVTVLFELYNKYDHSNDLLVIRLINVEKGNQTLIKTFFEKIPSDALVLDIKSILCKNLIQKMNSIKISGNILKVESLSIIVNVGDCQGVRNFKDQFRVTGKNTILQVKSIRENESTLNIISGDIPEVGDTVEMIITPIK